MGTFTFGRGWFYHLPDSDEEKAWCILNGWAGIYTHKDVIYCTTCNVSLLVLCYSLFHSDVNIVNMEESISTNI